MWRLSKQRESQYTSLGRSLYIYPHCSKAVLRICILFENNYRAFLSHSSLAAQGTFL
jgi:hypothetical protein